MYKKIMNPVDELCYRADGIDNKFLIQQGDRALGLFSFCKDHVIPTQISPQDVCFYIFEGCIKISFDDKSFDLNKGELLLIPKTSAYDIKILENTKLMTIRM